MLASQSSASLLAHTWQHPHLDTGGSGPDNDQDVTPPVRGHPRHALAREDLVTRDLVTGGLGFSTFEF